MSDNAHVRRVLDYLRAYYGDREGDRVTLNPVQILVYLDGLEKFSEDALQAAAKQHMQRSKFFPKLSELLDILEPKVDAQAAAQLAWSTVERAIRRAGAYRGVVFANGAIGETVRQVFGSWPFACSFELDSPGWAIRRQSFLAIYPAMEKRNLAAVTLRGMHESEQPLMIAPVPGLPYCMDVKKLPMVDDTPLTKSESVNALDEIKRRAISAGVVKE